MNIFEHMKEEHTYIKRLLKCMHKASLSLMNKEAFEKQDWKLMLTIIQTYIEDYHHGKEEVILFSKMMEEIHIDGEDLVRHSLLVEHDTARYHVRMLKDALQRLHHDHRDEDRLYVLTHAMAYIDIVQRHIDHEDFLIFPYAQGHFSGEILEKLDIEHQTFMHKINIEEQILLLTKLEKHYKIG